MNILFAVTHVGFLRNFESTLALMAERGHHVHIVSDRRNVADVIDGTPILERLKARFPESFSDEALGFHKRAPWYLFASVVRGALDYWRYLAPEFDAAPALRARGRGNASRGIVWLSDLPGLRSRAGIRLLQRLFTVLERAIPARVDVDRLLARKPWDVVFITPLLYFGSQQIDYVRAARRRSIPTILGVGSWDHLTTKGLIHERPDRLVVWNEHQRQEAAALHGIDPNHVIVTGAQAYDHWFARQPSTTRAEFCARVGLPADRPYLLYLCSSPFIAPREVDFVRDWIRAVRTSTSATLRTAGIMVRPHPQNAAQWAGVDLAQYDAAVIWPRAGANPINLAARHEYYDSMYHSHAVVGINTSALIESGIVGRLVYSVRASEFAGTQEGTLHFQHLKRGGLLRMAESLSAHTAQLERSFVSVDRDREEIREFIHHFVRPRGLDQAATPHVVDAAEAVSRLTPRLARLPIASRIVQAILEVAFLPLDPTVKRRLAPGLPRLTDRHRRDSRRAWLAVWRPLVRQPRRILRLARSSSGSVRRQIRHAGRQLRPAGRLRQVGRQLRQVGRQAWHAGRQLRQKVRKGARRLPGRVVRAIAALRRVGSRLVFRLYRWQKMGRARAPGLGRRAVRVPRRAVARLLGRGRSAAPSSNEDSVL